MLVLSEAKGQAWAIRWQLWLTVPVTDSYTFAVYADDGFVFNGTGLSVSNGTTRAPTTTETASGVVLTPGLIYNFAFAYMNYTTATTSTIQLLWRRAGGQLELVPREAIHARGRRDYYSFGGAVVAMKDGVMQSVTRTLSYLHGDHLGSASLTTDISGTVVSQQRYKPYGEVRWTSGAGMPTDKQFTGQTRSSYGTIFMSAREYLPSLGRFLSADSIVPGAGNPQALNRYAYVFNSPLGFVDPSGHDPLDAAWEAAWRANNCPTENPSCAISDEARQYRLYSVTYAGPVSGARSWTQADWDSLSADHNGVYRGLTERSSLSDFREALQRLASFYLPSEKREYVSGIALLFTGWPYDPTGGNIWRVGNDFAGNHISFGPGKEYYPRHGMAGFNAAFYEPATSELPAVENVHHWAGNLIFAFHYGSFANWFVAIAREAGSCTGGRSAECSSDINMGQAAAGNADWLRAGGNSIRDFADQVFEALRIR